MSQCQDLLEYAYDKLDNCPYGKDKPICSRCQIHCYKPEMREKIKLIMRKTGYLMFLIIPFYQFITF